MWKRFIAAMAVIVFLTAAGTSTAVLLEVDDSVNAFLRENTPIAGVDDVLDDVDAGGPQTLLVLGSDRRYDDKKMGIEPRSDTIILVRLDPSKDATAILSIPRDLKVSYRGPNGTYSDKINAAYSIGGPRATVRKVKELMESANPGDSFPIHHVINVNFGAFSKAVDQLGCFYVDIDRRYFNDNSPPVQSATRYAVIDLKPGYQKLCGQDALDFVRFRHLDTDIVRGARQQHFLGSAKDQTGVDKLFGNRKKLLTLFGKYTDTDIRSTSAVLRLLKLAYEASRDPLRRVTFRGDLGQEYVTITKQNLRRVRDEFENAQASEGAKGPTKPRAAGEASSAAKKRKKSSSSSAPGLVSTGTAGEDQAVLIATKMPFPAYYPKEMVQGGRFWDGFSRTDPRTYDLLDRDKKRHRAYRMVLEAPGLGEYYGVQGTDWMDPPILDNPSGETTVRGRKLLLYKDGSRLRLVAFKTSRAVYWVSNTLLRSLTNRQMIGIARSLTRMGG
jgi:LCP family protein required for cell wall assembly